MDVCLLTSCPVSVAYLPASKLRFIMLYRHKKELVFMFVCFVLEHCYANGC